MKKALALLLYFSLALADWAGKTANPPTYNATSTIFNGDGVTLNLLQSDGTFADPSAGASYTTGGGASSTVGGSSGYWTVDLSAQNVRTVYLQFSSLTAVSGAGWPTSLLADGFYAVALFSRCFDAAGNVVSVMNIPAGTSSNTCMFRIRFAGADGLTYVLHMGVNGSGLPSGAPPTGTATVTCNTADANGCTDWTITPYSLGANPTVADLVRLGYKGHPLDAVFGSYSGDTFRVHVTRP